VLVLNLQSLLALLKTRYFSVAELKIHTALIIIIIMITKGRRLKRSCLHCNHLLTARFCAHLQAEQSSMFVGCKSDSTVRSQVDLDLPPGRFQSFGRPCTVVCRAHGHKICADAPLRNFSLIHSHKSWELSPDGQKDADVWI